MKLIYRLLVTAAAGLLTACSSSQICTRDITKSDPAAVALLAASQRAQGKKAFENVRDVSVRYEGKWGSIAPRFQPVLVDKTFRGSSEERLILGSKRIIAQEHTGSAGKKNVLREPGRIAVAYNGSFSADEEAKRAAALVADAYTMFLLGPHYFSRPGVVLTLAGEEVVEEALCDQVLAVLRPGFGMAEEDRVILSIDRANKQLRRVRMTLNGLESTQGAEVEVTFRNFRMIAGVLWPTDFVERVRSPFDLHVHHWNMVGLDINRDLEAADFTVKGFKGRAIKPAASLP
ncbi:hypothetical protein BH11VER1_BH11VER1_11950 [soil metagenome]